MTHCDTSCQRQLNNGTMTEPPDYCEADPEPHEEFCEYHAEGGHRWAEEHEPEDCCYDHCEMDHQLADAA